jgi:hypothetical protein
MRAKSVLSTVALLAACGAALPAAAACSGSSVGSSADGNVTLGVQAAGDCTIFSGNAQMGPSGNSSGFSGEFGSGWSLLSKVTSSTETAQIGGVDYKITFSENSNDKSGTWSITADKSVTVDLAFAMHASSNSGAFLFDNQKLTANVADTGTWAINWLNNGGKVPDYSNLTLFARNQTVASSVPEPTTYAMLVAGLALIGYASRRRKQQ